MTGKGILVYENRIPVGDQVRGLCEILGFDPLYLANEGKVLFVTSKDEANGVL
jgi:hydrogenase expression/formation protein HypE